VHGARPRHCGGRGIARDGQLTQGLFVQACDRGDLAGCVELADGLTDDPNAARRRELWQRACNGGASLGCFRLAEVHAAGRGVARDDTRAAELDRRACDDAVAAACTALARMREAGLGGPRDAGQAEQLYARACGAGDFLGCARQAVLCQVTIGAERVKTGRPEAPGPIAASRVRSESVAPGRSDPGSGGASPASARVHADGARVRYRRSPMTFTSTARSWLRRRATVVIQEAAESLTALDRRSKIGVVVGRRGDRCDQPVVEALVICARNDTHLLGDLDELQSADTGLLVGCVSPR
jgi:TPR repeat protein